MGCCDDNVESIEIHEGFGKCGKFTLVRAGSQILIQKLSYGGPDPYVHVSQSALFDLINEYFEEVNK